MADRGPKAKPGPDESDTTAATRDRQSAPATPGWVKVFGVIGIVVLLLIGFILFTGLGGPHGPMRHRSSGDAGCQQTPSGPWTAVCGSGDAVAHTFVATAVGAMELRPVALG